MGDVIRAYKKGIHVITRFDDTSGRSSYGLVYYRTIFTNDMKPVKSKREDGCDISYARLVTHSTIEKELKEINEKYQVVISTLKNL